MNTTWDRAGVSGGELKINLAALSDNYRTLARRAQPGHAAAVVKADAYGLGADAVVRALAAARCRHFFVAVLSEGIAVREAAPEVDIFILNGVWPGTETTAEASNLIPVLNSRDQLFAWRDLARARGRRLPAAIQIDSGMSRLGLKAEDVAWLAANPQVFDDLDVRFLMTHLACADAPDDRANADQLAAFFDAVIQLPPTPLSIANSAATIALPAARGDLVRCGVALYGGAPIGGDTNPMRAVVELTGRVIQTRTIAAGAGVGYGLDYRAHEERRLATISVGYADGWPRRLGGRACAFHQGQCLPIVGRISMDSMVVDITGLADGAIKPGDALELIGPHQTLDEVAALAGTISYEILTGLSRRLSRLYLRTGES